VKVLNLRTLTNIWPILRKGPFLLYILGKLSKKIPLFRRHGHLFRQTLIDEIRGHLEPLDILLVNYNFRLNHLFIPSFFSHTGLYLGDFRLQGKVLKDSCLDVDADGVNLIPLDDFLDCDSLLVLRDRSLVDEVRRSEIFSEIPKHIGKKYDFRYDLHDPSRQYCTKMVLTLFSHLHLRERIPKTPIVVPDYLVWLSLYRVRELEMVMLYLNGEPVRPIPLDLLEERIVCEECP